MGRISPLLGPSHSFTPLHRAAQLTQTLGPSRPSAPLPSLRRSGSTDVWGLCRSVPLVHLPTLKRGTHVVRRFVPVEECVQELSPRGDRAGLANGARNPRFHSRRDPGWRTVLLLRAEDVVAHAQPPAPNSPGPIFFPAFSVTDAAPVDK